MAVTTIIPPLDRTSPTFKTDLDTFFMTTFPEWNSEVNVLQLDVNINREQAERARNVANASALAATTAADSASNDARLTALDRVQTGLDASDIAAARVQISADRADAAESAADAAASAASASAVSGIPPIAGNAFKVLRVAPSSGGMEWAEMATVTLDGDLAPYMLQSTVLTITNFDIATTYSVSATGGAVSRSGNAITYVAGSTPGVFAITIVIGGTSRSVPIVVQQTRGVIGTQGEQGFGVGAYPGVLPAGFIAMAGSDDKTSVNYGNYQFTDGSVMVFVPKFFYRFGNAASPRYATYGANALDIVGIDTYASEAAANTAGYAMHRVFYDGGAERSGVFIDKYLASKNGTASCKSIANADPIRVTAAVGGTISSGMVGCTGNASDAVVLARARGAGMFAAASVFSYSATALLALAHGQATLGGASCAWHDAALTKNFPKGCTTASLVDFNDSTVTYVSSYGTFPKSRATANFAKTTHNGQECGIADLSGCGAQILIGLTSPGTSATDTAAIASGDCYTLKRSVAVASLTGGFGGATDAWGTAVNLAVNYDAVSGLMPWGASTTYVHFGNGTNNVFSGATSGVSYTRTACGIQNATTGTSGAGVNLFGGDICYPKNLANLLPLASGPVTAGATGGVFFRDYQYGLQECHGWFRCIAYGI